MAELLGTYRGNYAYAELQLRPLSKASHADYLDMLEAIETNAFKEASNNTAAEDIMLEMYVNKLLKEKVRIVRMKETAEKRLAHYVATYRNLRDTIASIKGLMACKTVRYSDSFYKRLDLKHGRAKLRLENEVLHNLYSTKERISIYVCKLALIDSVLNSPKGLVKDLNDLVGNT